MLKLGPIYPRYIGPRLIIPGGTLDGGMLDLLHQHHVCHHNVSHSFRSAHVWNMCLTMVILFLLMK